LNKLFIIACIGLSRSANQSQWIGKSIQPWWPFSSLARLSMFSTIAFDKLVVSIPTLPTGSK